MIHQPMSGAQGQASDIEIQAKEILRMKDTLNRLLVKHTGKELSQIQNDTDRDFFMTGAEAIDLRPGDLWVIASSLFWALHVIFVGRMAMRTKAPLVVACGQFLACGMSGIAIGLLIEQPVLADFSGALFGILYAGLLSTGIGFTLQVVAQRFTHEADAAIILSSETVFAACAGFIFLSERLNLLQVSGAVLIFAGIIAVQLLPLLRSRAKALVS